MGPVSQKSKPIQRLALVCPGGLGDVLLFSSVIRACRAMVPGATLSLILEDRSQSAAQLLSDCVDTVEPFRLQGVPRWQSALALWRMLRSGNYNAVISCGQNPIIALMLAATGIPIRVGFHSATSGLGLTQAAPCHHQGYAGTMYAALAQAFAIATGLPLPESFLASSAHTPRVDLDVEDAQWFQHEYAPSVGLQPGLQPRVPWVVLHPGVSQVSIAKGLVKRWAPEYWATLTQTLRKQGIAVWLASGPDDGESVAAIQQALVRMQAEPLNQLLGLRNLRQLATVFSRASAVVCCDSAPMHVAIAAGVPTVALFGDFPPHRLLPPQTQQVVAITEPAGAIRNPAQYVAIEVESVRRAVEGLLASGTIEADVASDTETSRA